MGIIRMGSVVAKKPRREQRGKGFEARRLGQTKRCDKVTCDRGMNTAANGRRLAKPTVPRGAKRLFRQKTAQTAPT